MQQMKDNIHSQWEATDMGEPTKIVGIEITLKFDFINISYTEALLQYEHMECANLVFY